MSTGAALPDAALALLGAGVAELCTVDAAGSAAPLASAAEGAALGEAAELAADGVGDDMSSGPAGGRV